MTQVSKEVTTGTTSPAIVKKEKNITESVLARVRALEKNSELHLPPGYSAPNALKSAWLILTDQTVGKDGPPVLEVCTDVSIANALLKMVVEGLSPMKKQCDFIPYGNKLTMQREYHGTIALAKRFGKVKDVTANVVYQGDVFEYAIDGATGRRKIIKHEQSLENVIMDKIVGAYATLMMEDGTTEVEVMTTAQIKQSWLQGATKGASPAHRNFPDQMSIKTVINRACKLKISSSDDVALKIVSEGDDVEDIDHVEINSSVAIEQGANKKEMTFDEPTKEVLVPILEPVNGEPVKAASTGDKAQF